MPFAIILAILAQHGRETIAIIKSNQPGGVVVKTNLDSVGTQHFVESCEM